MAALKVLVGVKRVIDFAVKETLRAALALGADRAVLVQLQEGEGPPGPPRGGGRAGGGWWPERSPSWSSWASRPSMTIVTRRGSSSPPCWTGRRPRLRRAWSSNPGPCGCSGRWTGGWRRCACASRR
ncbi:hypothetical protein Q9966_016465 [Columba livia]|nr:hypothetical protein Q9966_016465 [Columba livia]